MSALTGNGAPSLDHEWSDFARTGPGTLAGRLARMFWQPVYRSKDLAPGWAVPIKIMSEEMTLYRGESGRIHLVDFRCAHRGAQLSTGWVEDDCIRCRYHGWMFDETGQCVHQPMEDPAFASKVRIRSYPVQEYIGLVFAYMGEGEAPPLPRYPAMEEEGVLEVDYITRGCNWVNQLENDPGHGGSTHRPYTMPKGVFRFPAEVAVEETECGIKRYVKSANGHESVSYRPFPNFGFQKGPPPDPDVGWTDRLLAWVPIDDENLAQFTSILVHVTGEQARRYEEGRHRWAESGGREFDPELSRAVLAGKLRLDDLERERADVNMTRVQDDATQIGQGIIRDKSRETLGRSDAFVTLTRKIWERELRALAEGRPVKQWVIPPDLESTEGVTDHTIARRVIYAR